MAVVDSVNTVDREEGEDMISKATQEVLDDLAGQTEIADALGVSRGLVSVWIKRHDDFPAPVVTLSAGRFYRLSEVLAWHARRAA